MEESPGICQEADRVTNAVVQMPEPGVQRQEETEEEETL